MELTDFLKENLDFMSRVSRNYALSNLYDRGYNIENYLKERINGNSEKMRREGFIIEHEEVIYSVRQKTFRFCTGHSRVAYINKKD